MLCEFMFNNEFRSTTTVSDALQVSACSENHEPPSGKEKVLD
jgi:hypothetical protein